MVCSCPVSALFSALAPRDCSKSTQSKATKHGVGLAGKPRCDCVKQPNEPFVLRSQPRRRGNAAHILRIPQAIRLPRPAVVCALRLCSTLAVLLTPAVGCNKQFRLCVSLRDRHVIHGDSGAISSDHQNATTRKSDRKLCHSCLTETSALVTSGIVPTVMQSTCLANTKNNQTLSI
jgi:hypothetical protein